MVSCPPFADPIIAGVSTLSREICTPPEINLDNRERGCIIRSDMTTLQQLLKPHGVENYRDLAALLGVTENYGYRLWTGSRPLSLPLIRRLYKKTGTAYEILIAIRGKDGKNRKR